MPTPMGPMDPYDLETSYAKAAEAGQEIGQALTETLEQFFAERVAPFRDFVIECGADPRPLLRSVADLLRAGAAAIEEQTGGSPSNN